MLDHAEYITSVVQTYTETVPLRVFVSYLADFKRASGKVDPLPSPDLKWLPTDEARATSMATILNHADTYRKTIQRDILGRIDDILHDILQVLPVLSRRSKLLLQELNQLFNHPELQKLSSITEASIGDLQNRIPLLARYHPNIYLQIRPTLRKIDETNKLLRQLRHNIQNLKQLDFGAIEMLSIPLLPELPQS
jgi:hypothetical protein